MNIFTRMQMQGLGLRDLGLGSYMEIRKHCVRDTGLLKHIQTSPWLDKFKRFQGFLGIIIFFIYLFFFFFSSQVSQLLVLGSSGGPVYRGPHRHFTVSDLNCLAPPRSSGAWKSVCVSHLHYHKASNTAWTCVGPWERSEVVTRLLQHWTQQSSSQWRSWTLMWS